MLGVAVLAATSLLLGGCVYLRLLELKRQFAAFDTNFTVATEDGIRIRCLKPVLLQDDVRWLGLAPERTRRLRSAAEWHVRWVKQLPPGAAEDGQYDIVVALLFADEKLSQVSIPERYFALMPKTFLIDLLRSLGGAKVDRGARSVEAETAAQRMDQPAIEQLLGQPTHRDGENGQTVLRYRYVPATATGLARAATFDMTLYFDAVSGRLLRWRGQTPVGNIGFRFTDSGRTPPPSPP